MTSSVKLNTDRAGVRLLSDLFNKVDENYGEINPANVKSLIKDNRLDASTAKAMTAVMSYTLKRNGDTPGFEGVNGALGVGMRMIARAHGEPTAKTWKAIVGFAQAHKGMGVDDLVSE